MYVIIKIVDINGTRKLYDLQSDGYNSLSPLSSPLSLNQQFKQ